MTLTINLNQMTSITWKILIMRCCTSLRRLKEREVRERERCEGKCECDNYTFGIKMLS